MLAEVPQSLLDELTDHPKVVSWVNSIPPEERVSYLFSAAERMIEAHGDGEEGEPKKTDPLILCKGLRDGKLSQRVTLQLLQDQDFHGYVLKVRDLLFGEENHGARLDITISEATTQWGEKEASPDQLVTAMRVIGYLKFSRLPPAMDPWKKAQIREDMKMSMRHNLYWWDQRRIGY